MGDCILVGLVMADVSLRSILQDREIFTLTFTNVGTALFLAFAGDFAEIGSSPLLVVMKENIPHVSSTDQTQLSRTSAA